MCHVFRVGCVINSNFREIRERLRSKRYQVNIRERFEKGRDLRKIRERGRSEEV